MSKIQELHIIDNENQNNIFDTDTQYIIPLYQRGYAWEEKQLKQLIEDIYDIPNEKQNYYIGSLIVYKDNNKYEVIDGQQRLTSLYLLLNCLGKKVEKNLIFECREKSNYTLDKIKEVIKSHKDKKLKQIENFEIDRIEASIKQGIDILLDELNNFNPDDIKKFCNNLTKLILYRIEVPQNTDLNRYFEIMNTRGEQLELHDILKANLMSYLEKDSVDQDIFSKIWDACADMTGYVQMHFTPSDREKIFGQKWNVLNEQDCFELLKSSNDEDKNKKVDISSSNEKTEDKTTDKITIDKIIDKNFSINNDDGFIEDDVRVRFESVIDFPYFLLHVLKVFVSMHNIKSESNNEIVDELLDDKKLIDSFDRVVSNGIISFNNEKLKISDNKKLFSKIFINCLLKTRFLFDKYIVKREYANDDLDGKWSIKNLHQSTSNNSKKAYYKNTQFEESDNNKNKTNVMIQSALRVSYTSPKIMHWITKLLIWLSSEKTENIVVFNEIAENIAIDAIKNNFFDVCDNNVFKMGVSTPHIVFNFLDYLLWSEDTKKYEDFNFEFRNSVEHWYPQHPSKGTFDSWDDVDSFGNLCIIQRNLNSKFSNMPPEAKNSTYEKMIKKGSLKLRIMSRIMSENNLNNDDWKTSACGEHEKAMIKILKEKCGISDTSDS